MPCVLKLRFPTNCALIIVLKAEIYAATRAHQVPYARRSVLDGHRPAPSRQVAARHNGIYLGVQGDGLIYVKDAAGRQLLMENYLVVQTASKCRIATELLLNPEMHVSETHTCLKTTTLGIQIVHGVQLFQHDQYAPGAVYPGLPCMRGLQLLGATSRFSSNNTARENSYFL